MKFKVTMKDPDALIEAIDEAVEEQLGEQGLPSDESDAVRDIRIEKAQKLCRTWFECGEYLTVEIDTEAKTCVVVPNKQA